MSHTDTSEQQFQFKDHSSLHDYRTEIPNIVEDLGLDPYAFRLYCHYKKVAGDGGACYQKKKTISEKTQMSPSSIKDRNNILSQPFELLNGKPLIKITPRKDQNGDSLPNLIEIIDIWPDNFKILATRFSNDPPPVAKKPTPGRQKTTEEEPLQEEPIKKDNVRDSAPIHGEKKKSPPPKVKLTSPQRMLVNKMISYKPEWGEPLKEADVTAWMLAKGWTVGRIEEVLELYKQRVIEYKARGEQIHSMGAMMRHALNTGEKPTDENYDKNVAYAKELSKTERCLEVTKRYVKIVAGIFEKEFYFTMPHKLFSDSLNQSLETCKAYS